MKKPTRELMDAFLSWFLNNPHSAQEDHYAGKLTQANLSQMDREQFIEFFYQFAREGGHVQSGGHRNASRFRATVEEKYNEFRAFVLDPFTRLFNEIEWLPRIQHFPHFGVGLATIFLNRVDKKRFAIINNRAIEAVELLDVSVPAVLGRRYQAVRDAWRHLIEWYPEFDNFYRADALSQFLIGEEVGKPWADQLRAGRERKRYWIYAPGERARHWDDFSRKGLMGIGWDTIKEDLSVYATEEELREKYNELYGDQATDKDFRQLCDFVQRVREGDGVFVKRGTKELVGYGEVTSSYFYEANRPEYRHLRRANWLTTEEWQIPEDSKSLPVKTLTELRDEERVRQYRAMLGIDGGLNPEYPLEQWAAETHFDSETLQRWVRSVERKKQAIFYGPPGTGKTFVAERLARHLIGGGDGFSEIVQFHPSYAYEDFMQGLRPRTLSGGGLEYAMVPGRFRDFCSRAGECKGRCVLIVDEINRANLSRVLGELMFLLEYRGQAVPLASRERFQIPQNVRIIGTMNTADRSIALVDHALRRRFAFLGLYPNYEVMRRFHADTGFAPEGLIRVLERLNATINDRHYSVGISFFLSPKIKEEVEDIWQMEIEPYIEELFFDQPDKAANFAWDKVKAEIM
jgi:MoxR-like ATPase